MSTPTHTPEPWIVHIRPNGEIVILDASRSCIAEVFAIGDPRDSQTKQANAELIASAPELLATLKACTDEIRTLRRASHEAVAGPCAVEAAANEIIAKAEGSK